MVAITEGKDDVGKNKTARCSGSFRQTPKYLKGTCLAANEPPGSWLGALAMVAEKGGRKRSSPRSINPSVLMRNCLASRSCGGHRGCGCAPPNGSAAPPLNRGAGGKATGGTV